MGIETVLEWLTNSRGFYIGLLEATPDGRLNWKPEGDNGDATSVLEITRHMIASEPMRDIVINGRWPEDTPMDPDWVTSASFASSGPAAAITDKAELVRLIREQGAVTDEALKGVPDSTWGDTISLPFMTATRAGFLALCATHWSYHTGQVAYLQRLYGDLRFME